MTSPPSPPRARCAHRRTTPAPTAPTAPPTRCFSPPPTNQDRRTTMTNTTTRRIVRTYDRYEIEWTDRRSRWSGYRTLPEACAAVAGTDQPYKIVRHLFTVTIDADRLHLYQPPAAGIADRAAHVWE